MSQVLNENEVYYVFDEQEEVSYNFDATQVVPSLYVKFPQHEQDNEETNLAVLASQSKAFDFLNDPAEDIYNLNDGKPV